MNVLPKKLDLNPKRASQLIDEAGRIENYSNFHFLNSHNGLRNNKLHLFIGIPGGGKSTLRNSLIIDYLNHNDKGVLLLLSEESVEDFETDMARNDHMLGDLSERIYAVSELDMQEEDFDPKKFHRFFENVIDKDIGLFMYDNVTTSRFYGDSFEQNNFLCAQIKKAIQLVECTTVIFAHTKSNISNGYKDLIDCNDVRGSKTIVNIAEFQYVLQKFIVGEKVFSTLRIVKHRGQDAKTKMYQLQWNALRRIYDYDSALEFTDFRGLYRNQNKLA